MIPCTILSKVLLGAKPILRYPMNRTALSLILCAPEVLMKAAFGCLVSVLALFGGLVVLGIVGRLAWVLFLYGWGWMS